MAAEAGVEVTVHATGDREDALRDAEFVTTSVAVQLIPRCEIDREIIRKHTRLHPF
jgi:alpha-galactosidase/6-phospho-beta-glucosidase family protein